MFYGNLLRDILNLISKIDLKDYFSKDLGNNKKKENIYLLAYKDIN